MAKYSIFINRIKCVETTSGSGDDEIYCVKFAMFFEEYDSPEIRVSEPFKIGNFSSGERIWLPDGTKYLHEAKEINDLRYTLFYFLLFEKDDSALDLYKLQKDEFKSWFRGRLKYYADRYPWNEPDRWRKKLISATYNRIDQYFNQVAKPGINDDDLIDVQRVLVKREDLDAVWGRPGVERRKNYTLLGDGGDYRAQIFIYGYHG